MGAERNKKRNVGFLDQKEEEEVVCKKALKSHFKPELLARIEEVIYFKELTHKDLLKIINQELKIIKDKLLKKGIEATISKSISPYILKNALKKNLHARDIKNLVKETVHVPLSRFLINNKAVEKITVQSANKEITFTV